MQAANEILQASHVVPTNVRMKHRYLIHAEQNAHELTSTYIRQWPDTLSYAGD